MSSGAAFTMRLKHAIEHTGGSVEKIDGLPVMTGGDIGLNNYPIFDESYRQTLNGKIIAHYYNREIGLETIDMFVWAVERRMMEIMPYYNKVYESTLIEFDPLSTIDIRTITTGSATTNTETEGQGETETTTDQGSRTVSSDTPQTMLSAHADYATSGVDVKSTGSSGGTSHETNSQSMEAENEGDSVTSGYQGVASELLARYRASLVNVDLAVIQSLEDCFMMLWNTSDAYTY